MIELNVLFLFTVELELPGDAGGEHGTQTLT